MKRTKTLLEKKTKLMNISNGPWAERFFTKAEQELYNKEQCLMEAAVEFATYTVYLEIDRPYLESKLGLRQVLAIMHKLSNGNRGALSKQLYAYYEKVGVSVLKKDLNKFYKVVDRMDFKQEPRQWISTDCIIHLGKKEYWGRTDGVNAMERIAKDHLGRCIAILREKGYIEITNKQFTRRYRRGGDYNYSNTYYRLTEKAEKLLGVGQPN